MIKNYYVRIQRSILSRRIFPPYHLLGNKLTMGLSHTVSSRGYFGLEAAHSVHQHRHSVVNDMYLKRKNLPSDNILRACLYGRGWLPLRHSRSLETAKQLKVNNIINKNNKTKENQKKKNSFMKSSDLTLSYCILLIKIMLGLRMCDRYRSIHHGP